MTAPHVPSATFSSVLPAHALAQNMTTSDNHVGWVSSVSGRSTSDILWSCFSILLVCTYKCIHFNVPSRKESEAGWFKWHGVYLPEILLWRKWAKKGAWMMLVVLAPEVGVALAMRQYLFARECRVAERKDQKTLHGRNGVEVRTNDFEMAKIEVKLDEGERQEITNTHTFFANMGGFALRICALPPPDQGHIRRDQISHDKISRVNNQIPDVIEAPATVKEITYQPRNWQDLYFYLSLFPDLKLPSEQEIKGLSKADAFTKAFACVQSSWLIIQSIVRVSVGLPITQLELATIAFVVCALIMYILWWDKPFGVESRATITAIVHDAEVKTRVANGLAEHLSVNSNFSTRSKYIAEALGVQSEGALIPKELDEIKYNIAKESREYHIPDLTLNNFFELVLSGEFFSKDGLTQLGKAILIMVGNLFGRSGLFLPPREQTVTLTLYAAGTVFSAFHMAAWNWEFPSSTARMLWRIFAVAATSSSPIALLYCFIVIVIIDFSSFDVPIIVTYFMLSFFLLVYIISRIGLVILTFYCFSSMPAGVYETVNWLQFLPHFS